MAMEGRTSACAHLSPLGNIAGVMADTWSNESVQNIKLLAAMAPTCYVEQLAYDCRLMNAATARGREAALGFRDLMVDSDAGLDPQAWVLRPDVAIQISQAIVAAPDHYAAGIAAANTAIACLQEARASGALRIPEREVVYLEMMAESLSDLPTQESAFIDRMLSEVDTTRFQLAEYGL